MWAICKIVVIKAVVMGEIVVLGGGARWDQRSGPRILEEFYSYNSIANGLIEEA